MQVPINALNNKISPTALRIKEYKLGSRTSGVGIKNIARINLKALSALF